MAEDASQKEAQEKALVYQILQAQLEELGKQSDAIDARAAEFEAAKAALGDMGKADEGKDVLIPAGAGCYFHGKLGSKDRFLVEIGAGFAAEKDLAGALASVDDKMNEIEKLAEKVEAEMVHLRGSMDKLGLELNEMMTGKAKVKPPEEKEEKPKDKDIIVD